MNKKIFNQDVFEKLFDEVEDKDQVDTLEANAYTIIGTISSYIDCLGSFINTINMEEVDKAISLLSSENLHKLYSLNRADSALALLEDIKNERKATSADLF